MAKKMKVMSISLEPETQEIMSRASKKMGLKSTSDLVRKLVKNFALDREDVKAVVLQIPVDILADRVALTDWLAQRSQALVNLFCPESKQ